MGKRKRFVMDNSRGFRKLIVWKRMQELVVLVYKLANKLPEDEKYGLISQMKRAVVSVLSNFVEGYLKSSKKEKLVYMERAKTSLLEVDAQIEVCLVLGFLTQENVGEFLRKRDEVSYLLYRYQDKIF